MGSGGATGEVVERRTRHDDVRFHAACAGALLAPGMQAIVAIAHVLGLTRFPRGVLRWGLEALLNGAQQGWCMAPGLIRRHARHAAEFFCVTRRAARELKQDRLSQHFKGGRSSRSASPSR